MTCKLTARGAKRTVRGAVAAAAMIGIGIGMAAPANACPSDGNSNSGVALTCLDPSNYYLQSDNCTLPGDHGHISLVATVSRDHVGQVISFCHYVPGYDNYLSKSQATVNSEGRATFVFDDYNGNTKNMFKASFNGNGQDCDSDGGGSSVGNGGLTGGTTDGTTDTGSTGGTTDTGSTDTGAVTVS